MNRAKATVPIYLPRPRTPRRFNDPPPDVVSKLESAARKDLHVARLTLGLYASILGDEPSRIFPGYHWQQKDLANFPVPLRSIARRLLKWGQAPSAALIRIMLSRIAIMKAVHTIRRRSPYGRKCRDVVSKLRAQYPLKRKPRALARHESTSLKNITILEEVSGLPLTDRTMRLVKAFKPSAIQIAIYSEPMMEHHWAPGVINIRLNPDGYTVESSELTVEMDRPKAKLREIEGSLFDYSETGTEGAWWALRDDDNFGYDNLRIIEPGDHLTILDQLGYKLWSGVIRYDRKAGWRPYPQNPKYGQPCALCFWIHWTQKGFKPDDWARFFIRPGYDRLRGVLQKSLTNKK